MKTPDKSMPAEVSVVLCTRNGLSRGFLHAAMKSVCEQTAPPSEIILVDDGSTDGTASAIRAAYPGVTVVANDGAGLAAARNTGIQRASSPWIAFMDDDDVWSREKLAEQMGQIATSAEPESTIWASRTAIIKNSDSAPVPVSTPVQFARWPACLLGCPVQQSGVLFSRQLFRQMGPLNEDVVSGATYEYWIRCLAAGTKVEYSQKILLFHRIHHDQMTSPSRLLAIDLTFENFLVPYFKSLAPPLESCLRTARLLLALRQLAVHSGFRAARRLWASTLLRPVHLQLRTLTFFVLDSVGSRSPRFAARWLRDLAVRILLEEL
jgi:glycosyltransferase involved in cell wall biosynthesis